MLELFTIQKLFSLKGDFDGSLNSLRFKLYYLQPAIFCPVCFCFWRNKVSHSVKRKSFHIKKVTSTLSLSLFSQLNQFRSVLNEIFPDTVHPSAHLPPPATLPLLRSIFLCRSPSLILSTIRTAVYCGVLD